MQSIEDLVQFVLQQTQCVVFGDVGRYPRAFLEALKNIPQLKVVVVDTDPPRLSKSRDPDDRIRVVRCDTLVEKCDVLIHLEPASLKTIDRHPLANRVIVLTSHFTFKTAGGKPWTHVCFYQKTDVEGTRLLLEKQDFSIQTRNVGLARIDRTDVTILTGRDERAFDSGDRYVIVNLTDFDKDALSMYLAFADAFDVMLENRHSIDRWVVCFPVDGIRSFERFTQHILDSLLCKRIEYGNVTDIRTVVSLLPFYRSGTLDRSFDVQVFSFGGIRYVAPKTIEEACKAAVTYNVYPIVKNVLGIQG